MLIAPDHLVEQIHCASDVDCRSLFRYGAQAAVTNRRIVLTSADFGRRSRRWPRRQWWRRRRNPPFSTARAVPVVVIIDDVASHAAITREVRATVAVDQFTAGEHQATRAAGPSVLHVRSEMAVTGGARRIKYRTLRGEACFADDPVFER